MIRLIHTSDWQVGMKGGGLGEAAARVAEERLAAIGRLLALAAEREADVVVAAGDLFEDNRVDPQLVDALASVLRAHPAVPIHAICGNHDLPGPGSVWNRVALTSIPHLVVHREPAAVPLLDGALTLHVFPVRSRYDGRDPLAALPDLADEPRVHVGVAHGHLTTITFGAHEEELRLPVDPAQAARAGLDYLALGHWHGTRLVDESDGAARVAYSGTPEQTAYAETDAGNALVVEIDGKGAAPRVEVVRVGGLVWAREELAFAGDADLSRLVALLDAEPRPDLLRLSVTGELPTALYADYRERIEAAADRFADLRIRDDGLRWLTEETAEPLPVADASLAAAQQRLQDAANEGGDGAAAAREALLLLNRFIREAGLCD